MPVVIKKYYKIDPSRILDVNKADYIFRVDKDTGRGLDISELIIFENSNLLPMLEKLEYLQIEKYICILNEKEI